LLPILCLKAASNSIGDTLRRTPIFLTALLLGASAGLLAQTIQSASNDAQPLSVANDSFTPVVAATHSRTRPSYTSAPFSRMAFGGGVSAMGINLQAAVIANRYMNLRGVGNFFNYSINNISTNGLNVSGKLNFATAGASVDFFPFPNHGFRLSPGVLFYNQNQVTATMVAPGGTSFTLNDYTYYSSQANPVTGAGGVSLNKRSPAFTITTGWGNMIPRRGGHFSFPFEIGAAFVGSPAVNMALLSGQVCADPQGTVGCQNVVGNSQIDSNLQAQVAKYQSDLNPLNIYPIFSFGVAYSFGLRGEASRGVH
jgi:hypothetical protein